MASIAVVFLGGCSASPLGSTVQSRVRGHVGYLAGVGPRCSEAVGGLNAAAEYVEASLRAAGLRPTRSTYEVDGVAYHNISAEFVGTSHPKEIIVFGAHYDCVPAGPGADDNGSGVACLLELAHQLRGSGFRRTLRLTFWTNEEPPHFQTETMGSLVEAKRSRARGEDIRAVVALDTVGYYTSAPDSQRFPLPALRGMYPTTGDFLAVVSNLTSAPLARKVKGAFDDTPRGADSPTTLPTHQLSAHESVPGVGWSDHWSYWQAGYPAVMLSDTAPWRNPNYHLASDGPGTLSYPHLERLVTSLAHTAKVLTEPSP